MTSIASGLLLQSPPKARTPLEARHGWWWRVVVTNHNHVPQNGRYKRANLFPLPCASVSASPACPLRLFRLVTTGLDGILKVWDLRTDGGDLVLSVGGGYSMARFLDTEERDPQSMAPCLRAVWGHGGDSAPPSAPTAPPARGTGPLCPRTTVPSHPYLSSKGRMSGNATHSATFTAPHSHRPLEGPCTSVAAWSTSQEGHLTNRGWTGHLQASALAAVAVSVGKWHKFPVF